MAERITEVSSKKNVLKKCFKEINLVTTVFRVNERKRGGRQRYQLDDYFINLDMKNRHLIEGKNQEITK